jgi:acyl-CoA synthetase (AMP-forming)/AMP-acid ligase II
MGRPGATSNFLPLDQLLSLGRPDDFVVALDGSTSLQWKGISGHISGLALELQNQESGRWLVSCESPLSFLISLLALWSTDRVAVLPPSHQPRVLSETASDVNGMLTDRSLPPFSLPTFSPLQFTKTGFSWKTLNSSDPLLEIFTSGSTGKPIAVSKTLHQLGKEIDVLESVFGSQLGRSVIFSTVSHQHIYGLLFRVLWPICSGRIFDTQTHLFWKDLMSIISRHPASALITSPSHLERIETWVGQDPSVKNVTTVFSSGGPLSEPHAIRTQSILGQLPIEVFGSTETGGVGWRQQSQGIDPQLWNPFPQVVVSHQDTKGDLLNVRSPFVGNSDLGITLGDRGVVFADGKFRVDGRADRIVKIAEKRVSLDDIENRFSLHPYVKDIKSFVLKPQQERNRCLLSAVIILTDEGRTHLFSHGKFRLIQVFKKYMLDHFEGTVIPRLFRFVEKFPQNFQGKVTLDELSQLFLPIFDKNVTAPILIQKEFNSRGLLLKASVPPNLGYFDGHFPGYPIVPGIVQIQWAIDLIKSWNDKNINLGRLEQVKFKTPMRPGQYFSLQVTLCSTPDTDAMDFLFTHEETVFSSGRFILS